MPEVTINNIVKKIIKNPEDNSERIYYFGSIPSNQLKSVTFVPVDEKNPKQDSPLNEVEGGYQRYGNVTRMRAFKKHLHDKPLSIVPPIVLSSRNKWTFNSIEGNDMVGNLIASEPAAIIDGQHRAGGYVLYDSDENIDDIKEVSFILIPDVEEKQEVIDFLDINQKQQKVTISHVVNLGATYLDDEDSIIAKAMNDRDDSLFYKKIFTQRATDGELYNMAAIKACVELTFKRGGLNELSVNEKIQTMIQYWNQISDNHPQMLSDLDETSVKNMKFKLYELTGIYAYSMVAPEILGSAFSSASGTFNWDEVNSKLQRASVIDWRKDGEFENRAGKVAASQYLKPEIESLIGGQDQ